MLRRLEPRDLDALFLLYRDPDVRRHFPDGTRTFEETKRELEWFQHGYPEFPTLGLWATVERASGAFLGGALPGGRRRQGGRARAGTSAPGTQIRAAAVVATS
ncbi:MAG: GNAT family N-acetyltransferase [Vicinamibacterales bacterium]